MNQSMPQLFYDPLSTFSMKVLLALAKLRKEGLVCELELKSLSVHGRTSPEFRAFEAMYPVAKVPVLRFLDGRLLPESTLIVEYLCALWPQTALMGSVKMESAKINADSCRLNIRYWDRILDLNFAPNIMKLLLDEYGIVAITSRDRQRALNRAEYIVSDIVERLSRNRFLVEDCFTLADCALLPLVFYLKKCSRLSVSPIASDYSVLEKYFDDHLHHCCAVKTVLDRAEQAWQLQFD